MMITQHLEFGEDIAIRPHEKEGMCLLSHECGHLCVLLPEGFLVVLSPFYTSSRYFRVSR